jgi:hypothetical protein
VQPQHSAHTASPVLRAVEDSTYLANSLLSGGTYPSPLHSAAPTCHLHALRARPQIQHVTRTSAQPRPRPPTHPRRRLRLSLLAPLSKQGVRQSPWPTARRHTPTHTGRRAHTTEVHSPWPAHARTRAAHSPTHSRTHAPTHCACAAHRHMRTRTIPYPGCYAV